MAARRTICATDDAPSATHAPINGEHDPCHHPLRGWAGARFSASFPRIGGGARCRPTRGGQRAVLKNVLAPIHPDGWRFIAIAALATILLFALWEPLGWLGIVATAWCIYFFRDPWRVTPTREGLVIAPADRLGVSVDR